MKKKINIRFIIFIAVVVLVLALIIFGIVKLVNKNKNNTGYTQIAPEEYSKIVEKEGYTVNDIIENLQDYGYIKNALMGVSKDNTYEIEYYNFEDEVSAFNFLENKITAISMLMGSDGTIDEVDTDEYSKYAKENSQYYCLIFKIGTTVICSDVKADQKNEIIKVFKKLGYMN